MSAIDNFPQILKKPQRLQVTPRYDTDLQNLSSLSVFTPCGNLALCRRYFETVADIQKRKRQESIGARTADCPTFVTRSGPCYSSFPLHAKDETRQSLSQNANTVLRLHGHLKQLFTNIPQRQVPTGLCWTDIYHSWILATWRELYTCTYIGHLSLSHDQGYASFSTKLKSSFSFVPTAQLYGVFMGQISFFTFCRIACHIELGRLGRPPPTALLQSVYVHIFLVRCTIIASSVKYTCCGTAFRNRPLYVYVSLVPTAKETHCGSITNTRRLILLIGLFFIVEWACSITLGNTTCHGPY
jgi:hypothetical protein